MRRAVILLGVSVWLVAVLIACTDPTDPAVEPGADPWETPEATEVALPTLEPSTPTPQPTATQIVVPSPTPTALPTQPPTATPTPAPARPAQPTPTPPAVGGPTRDPRWQMAIQTADDGVMGVVTADALNIRSAPRVDAPVVGVAYARHPVTVYGDVSGDPVNGNPMWFRVGANRYVAAAFVDPLIPPAPTTSYGGHWVDINLSDYYAIAYVGKTPVYAAIIVVGKPTSATPVGEHRIIRRVANETMDSATVGIPKGSPGYYYLTDVKWTQYFAEGGFALHTNYWRDPSTFGTTGSNGCINLLEKDARWFWEFLAIGSAVSIHD